MRVLIAGGRDFDDRELLFRVLNEQHTRRTFTRVIHGGASRADDLAAEWADAHGIDVDAKPASWKRHGRAAGAMRNSQMFAENPDLVIIFHGDKSTADLLRKANTTWTTIMHVHAGETL